MHISFGIFRNTFGIILREGTGSFRRMTRPARLPGEKGACPRKPAGIDMFSPPASWDRHLSLFVSDCSVLPPKGASPLPSGGILFRRYSPICRRCFQIRSGNGWPSGRIRESPPSSQPPLFSPSGILSGPQMDPRILRQVRFPLILLG